MLPSRGKGLWREEFYSLCSKHRDSRDDCNNCAKGQWMNVCRHKFGHAFYMACPNIWRWWVNLPGIRASNFRFVDYKDK